MNKNIHILPTDKPSKLGLCNNQLVFLSKHQNILVGHKNYPTKNQNIYIINDEKIKDGDWFLWQDFSGYWNLKKCEIIKYEGKPTKHLNCAYKIQFKIILTTDSQLIFDGIQVIDDKFLEWFVKNPNCENVKIDLVPVNEFGSEITVGGYGFDKFKYKIIIPQEEPKMTLDEEKEFRIKFPKEFALIDMIKLDEAQEKLKQETLEDAAEDNAKKVGHYAGYQDFIAGAKWQAERMYSEEDMINFAEFVASYPNKNRNYLNQMLHAKSKYDGSERTIDLLELFKKKTK